MVTLLKDNLTYTMAMGEELKVFTDGHSFNPTPVDAILYKVTRAGETDPYTYTCEEYTPEKLTEDSDVTLAIKDATNNNISLTSASVQSDLKEELKEDAERTKEESSQITEPEKVVISFTGEVTDQQSKTPVFTITPKVVVEDRQTSGTKVITDTIKNEKTGNYDFGDTKFTFKLYLNSKYFAKGDMVMVEHKHTNGNSDFSYHKVEKEEGDEGALFVSIAVSEFSDFVVEGRDQTTIEVSIGPNVKSATLSIEGTSTPYDLMGRETIDLPMGENVTVNAEAARGYLININPSRTTNVNDLKKISVYAYASGSGGGQSYFYLTLRTGEGASAQPTCDKDITKLYSTTTTFTVTAADPVEGYDFDGWYDPNTGNKESSDKLYTITLSSVKTLEARYVMKEMPPVDEAVKKFVGEVGSIPAEPTWKDRELVDTIQADYEKLTDEQKKQSDVVVAKEKLDKAVAAVAASEKEMADQEVAERFTAAVNAVPGNKAGEGKGLVDKATEIYNTMTDAQKALVKQETYDLYDEELAAFKKDRMFCSGDGYYRVLSNGDVTYHHPASKDITGILVPNQVKKGKFFFKVIKVSNNAFRKCKSLKWAVISKNVYVFGEYIFARDEQLMKVRVFGTGFRSGKVTDAFVRAGKNGRLTVKVPGNKVDEYNALFTGEGGLVGSVKAA